MPPKGWKKSEQSTKTPPAAPAPKAKRAVAKAPVEKTASEASPNKNPGYGFGINEAPTKPYKDEGPGQHPFIAASEKFNVLERYLSCLTTNLATIGMQEGSAEVRSALEGEIIETVRQSSMLRKMAFGEPGLIVGRVTATGTLSFPQDPTEPKSAVKQAQAPLPAAAPPSHPGVVPMTTTGPMVAPPVVPQMPFRPMS